MAGLLKIPIKYINSRHASIECSCISLLIKYTEFIESSYFEDEFALTNEHRGISNTNKTIFYT